MDFKKKIIQLSAKNWLLLDGLGAIVTAIMCQVVARLEPIFGMPVEVMMVLFSLALCFAVFSFSSYLFVKTNHKKHLCIILTANATYCIATFVLAAIHFEKLTGFGIAYFAGEILIVAVIVYSEYTKVTTSGVKKKCRL